MQVQASRWGVGLVWCLVFGLVLASGCRRENPSNFDDNFPPETYISGAPAESTLSYYRVHLFWSGSDSDGSIGYYEYAVTDSNKVPGEDTPGFVGYYRTTRTDSVFQLSADNPQILGHRFYVRAVDNEGKTDPTPAWAYFVAHDYNFPNVVFHRQIGTWTDREGNVRTRTINSTHRYAPTDTIGVGGTVQVSWSGYDVDVGGSVVGYVYRTSADTDFKGGSPADTSITFDFSPEPVGGVLKYFSGTEVVQVRAVDDAGAQTQPDSVRSVVVNFNPVTWILDPESPDAPVRRLAFVERSTQAVYPSGTTLALSRNQQGRSIEFYGTAFDDPREQSVGAEDNAGIVAYSWRRLRNGGGPAWSTRYLTDWVGYPGINHFFIPDAQNLESGNFHFMIRGQDVLGRWGTPDTVMVRVNYDPFFTAVDHVSGDGAETPIWIDPTSPEYPGTATVSLTPLPGGGYPDFRVRFTAVDDHEPPPATDPLDPNVVVEQEVSSVEEIRARLNGSTQGYEPAPGGVGERVFSVSAVPATGVIAPGTNTLDLAARDINGRTRSLRVVFRVELLP